MVLGLTLEDLQGLRREKHGDGGDAYEPLGHPPRYVQLQRVAEGASCPMAREVGGPIVLGWTLEDSEGRPHLAMRPSSPCADPMYRPMYMSNAMPPRRRGAGCNEHLDDPPA